MPSPIPQPKGLPILGNLFDLDGNNPWGSFNKLAAQYRPIFKISILGHEIVFVTGAALLEEICDETRFRKCVAGPIVEIRAAVHDSLFTAYHSEMEAWGVAHRIMSPMVSAEAIEQIFGDLLESTDDLIAKWTATPRQRVDIVNDLDRNNHIANMSAFFHQRLRCQEGPEPAIIAAMQDATTESMRRTSRPKFLTWLFYQRKWDADIRIMRDYCADIVATRRAAASEEEEEEQQQPPPKDILHALLHGKDPQTGKSLTESQVLDEIINLFIGSATAPNLVAFALYYLLKNPQEIEHARQEIDAVVGGAGGPLTHAHLAAQLPYCEAILRETLRLSAPRPGSTSNPSLPRTQPLIALLTAVNRDPAVFDDPEAFRPARMVGEKYAQLPAGVKKGFGNGTRACFGTRYAWTWSLLCLVRVLQEVDLELADASYEVTTEGRNYNGAFSTRPVGFFAVASARK
ncbi:hypothetical protein ARAM_007504 [Aspergillus rambellii]|uniref:Cytochrome P450 n=1 Tax=Aspergillus rambellii TaxID=308745 RepID=A0A0F8UZQ2_9EURO|nr:hypothetical protein ARAM_007504 [Aspergillus rambellii]